MEKGSFSESELPKAHLPSNMRGNSHTINFLRRSSSTKEPQPPQEAEVPFCLSPRLTSPIAASLSLHRHSSSPPRLSFSPAPAPKLAAVAAYHCISSVLKKDGQIISAVIDSGLVYTGSQSNVIRIWKLPEFTECGQLKTKACMVVALMVSEDRVYAAYADCRIRIWRRKWEGALEHVRLATVPAAGSFVRSYLAGRDKMMKHLGPISAIAINTSEDILYSSSLDTTVKVWRISDFKCIETIQAHHEPINAITVSEDNGALYTASDDATVKVWRRNFYGGAGPHSLTVTLPARYSPVKTLALSSDGGFLYGGCTDGYIHYWVKGWRSGQLQYGGALSGHTHAIMCLATVAKFMVSGSVDATSRIWIKEPDGLHTCIAVLHGHKGPVRSVAAFLEHASDEGVEDRCMVCTGSVDGVLKLWRVWKDTSPIKGSSRNGRECFEL